MAHEIDTTAGRAAVFTAGEQPWHRLGVNVAEAQTSAEAIRLAGLDWEVLPRPLFAGNADGTYSPVPDRVANVRSDTGAVLGVVSTGYRVFQNRQAFDFMDAIVGDKLAVFETAGGLKGGRRVWMLARLPKTIRVAKSDAVEPYVLLTNGHDGSAALRMIPTTVRVVCQNTLNLATSRASSTEGLTVFHFENLEARVEDARRKLGVITDRLDAFAGEARRLAKRQVTTEELRAYFEELLPDVTDDNKAKLLAAWNANFEADRQTLPGIRGSAWAAFNAVSEWADHQKWVTGKTAEAKTDNRLNSIWFGAANAVKQQAFVAALGLAA